MRFKKFFMEQSSKSYSAVVLDDASRAALLDHPTVQQMIPPGSEVIAHHMTIKLGSLTGTPHIERLGKAEEFTAYQIGTAKDGMVLAVKVDGISDNKNPHITVAINRDMGAKPKDSNLITNWESLNPPVTLKGAVLEL